LTSPLWAYVNGVERMPVVLVVLLGVPIACRLSAHEPSEGMIGFALLLVVCALVGAWQHRRNPRSLRSILLLFQLSGWPLALAFAVFMWNVSYLTGTHELYAERLPLLIAMFAAVLAIVSAYYIAFWRDGRDLYEALGARRSRGSISPDELHQLLTFKGRSTRMLAVMPVIVGLSVPITMVIARLIDRNIWELTVFVLLTFILPPYIMAVLIARRFLQSRYLGASDLTVG